MLVTKIERDVMLAALHFLLSYLDADQNGLADYGMELTKENVKKASDGHLKAAEKIAGHPVRDSYQTFHRRVEALVLRLVEAIERDKV